MPTIAFRKMHGTGNDFVVFDARSQPLAMTAEQVLRLADRRRGIGCDQVIFIEPSESADALMRIYNADGSEAASCGNASRCVGSLLLKETGKPGVELQTKAGPVSCRISGEGVEVNMGAPRFQWQEIPLSRPMDTLNVVLVAGPLINPAAVSMGNPHAVFFVDDVETIPLDILGPVIENDPLFPERVNVSVAHAEDGNIRLRVWERGAGETLACGTAASAALVAAHRRGLSGRHANVILPGGVLKIEWLPENEGGQVLMTGPVETSFEGSVTL